jgi:hypothetical protein
MVFAVAGSRRFVKGILTGTSSWVDTLGKMLRAGTITPEMHDAAKDFEAAFIVANLDPLRALPILRVPGTGRDPDLNDRQLHARRRVHQALEALGGISSPAGSCVWHVVGLQRSVREWAMRQGWGGRAVRQEQAQGISGGGLGSAGKLPRPWGTEAVNPIAWRRCKDEPDDHLTSPSLAS